jgi:hypothetical protein
VREFSSYVLLPYMAPEQTGRMIRSMVGCTAMSPARRRHPMSTCLKFPRCVLMACEDITEHKQVEAEKERLETQVRQSQKIDWSRSRKKSWPNSATNRSASVPASRRYGHSANRRSASISS